MLPRQCPPIPEAGRNWRLPDWKIHFAVGLLLASHLVPVPVWGKEFLLYSRARQTLGTLPGLVGDAAMPAFFQAHNPALACRGAGEVARDHRPDSNPFVHLPADEASRFEYRPFQIQPGRCGKPVLA